MIEIVHCILRLQLQNFISINLIIDIWQVRYSMEPWRFSCSGLLVLKSTTDKHDMYLKAFDA